MRPSSIWSRRGGVAGRTSPQADAQLRIRLALGDLQELVGAYDDAESTYRRVLAAGFRHPGMARAGIGPSRSRPLRRCDAHLDDAFADPALGPGPSPALARARLDPDVERGDGRGDRRTGAGHRRTAGSGRPVAGQLLIELARAESYAGRLDAALEHALARRSDRAGHDDLRGQTAALRMLGLVQHDLGRLDAAAARCAATSISRGASAASRVWVARSSISGSWSATGASWRRQSHATARRSRRSSVSTMARVARSATPTSPTSCDGPGELEEAEQYAVRARDLADEIGHAMTRADSIQILGEISLARGAARRGGHACGAVRGAVPGRRCATGRRGSIRARGARLARRRRRRTGGRVGRPCPRAVGGGARLEALAASGRGAVVEQDDAAIGGSDDRACGSAGWS